MKVEIDVTVQIETALCIGSGVSTSTLGVDRLTLKDADGNLLIPGSAFKGKLRMGCEQILKTLEIGICNPPDPASMCPHYFWNRGQSGEKAESCEICQIFGSPWHESPLQFTDLIWQADVWEKQNTHIRPGIAIARRRGVVEEDRLFYTETSPPNVQPEFKGSIIGKLTHEKQLALVLIGLENIHAFGNSRSRGLGWSSVTYELTAPVLAEDEIGDAMKGWT
jgi:CRISPR/Cas system CSM-associated protein Csm3 (group 7 of RAMP superfamily)